MIPILMVTHNRFAYSVLAYQAIKLNTTIDYKLFIYDNGSTDETQIWLKYLQEVDPSVDVFKAGENKGLSAAMNHFIRKYQDCSVLAKVDNDCIMPPLWLHSLLNAMSRHKMDVISGKVLRPYGDTWKTWSNKYMTAIDDPQFQGHKVWLNSYCAGSGVLIRTKIFKENGLLFEKLCELGTWTTYQRSLHEKGYRIGFYDGVTTRQLNLKEEHVLSNDYPEYDEKIKKIRQEGNRIWSEVIRGDFKKLNEYYEQNGGIPKI